MSAARLFVAHRPQLLVAGRNSQPDSKIIKGAVFSLSQIDLNRDKKRLLNESKTVTNPIVICGMRTEGVEKQLDLFAFPHI